MRYYAAAAIAALSLVSAAPAMADCAMNYGVYEFAVPHLDLETCPQAMVKDNTFCRAAIAGHELYVYQFEQGGEQCLLAVSAVTEDRVKLTIE